LRDSALPLRSTQNDSVLCRSPLVRTKSDEFPSDEIAGQARNDEVSRSPLVRTESDELPSDEIAGQARNDDVRILWT
jgi:hypothetical protein